MPSQISGSSFLFALGIVVFMFSHDFQGPANEVYFVGFFIIMDRSCVFQLLKQKILFCNYSDNTKKMKIWLRGRADIVLGYCFKSSYFSMSS